MLVVSKNQTFNETRWQEMELGQFVLLIHQNFGSSCSLTQEGEWGRFQVKKLSGALFAAFCKKNHTHRKFYPPCDDSLPTKNVRDIDHSSRVSLNCLRSIHMIRLLQTLILLYSVRVAAKHERFHNFSRGDFKDFMGRWRANCSTEG